MAQTTEEVHQSSLLKSPSSTTKTKKRNQKSRSFCNRSNEEIMFDVLNVFSTNPYATRTRLLYASQTPYTYLKPMLQKLEATGMITVAEFDSKEFKKLNQRKYKDFDPNRVQYRITGKGRYLMGLLKEMLVMIRVN